MKRLAFTTCLLFLLMEAGAQKYVDVAKFYYNNSGISYFESSEARTRVMEMGVDLTIPLVINADNTFLTGLTYDGTQTRLFEDSSPETIALAGLRLGLVRKHSDRWSGTYILIPKLAFDFKNVSGKDFQLGAIVLMKYTKREGLNYKVGAYYSSEFFGPMFVPLFGLYYLSPNKKFETNLTLPLLADANYKLNGRVYIGVNFFGQVRSYHLSVIPNKESYVVKTSNDLFGYLKFNLSKSLSIQTKFGYALGRSYRVYNEADKITFGSVLIRVGDHRDQLNKDFSSSWIGQATLVYRVFQD